MLPALRIDGVHFRDASTTMIVPYVGVSDFALFKRWRMNDGPIYLVEPRLREWRTYAKAGGYGDRPIVLRVFRYASPTNQFGIPPWSYPFEELRKFTAFCSERGFYVDWTAGDNQVVLPDAGGPHGQQQHLNETCAALAPIFCFIETCNEPMKNGLDVAAVKPANWGSYLCDSGMYADHDTWIAHPEWNLDFVSFHGRRDDQGQYWPRWLTDMPEAAASMLTMFGKPAVHKEPMRCNRTGTARDAAFWYRMGQIVAYCGVTYHSENARDGDHLTMHEGGCAIEFFAGAATARSFG